MTAGSGRYLACLAGTAARCDRHKRTGREEGKQERTGQDARANRPPAAAAAATVTTHPRYRNRGVGLGARVRPAIGRSHQVVGGQEGTRSSGPLVST